MKIKWIDFKLNSEQLLPVIIQDEATQVVLMMAYMNEASFNKTIETKETWFWSRSRNELWHKGATSGHIQKVKSMLLDCDSDTLLIQVDQTGAACHTGEKSCFFNLIE